MQDLQQEQVQVKRVQAPGGTPEQEPGQEWYQWQSMEPKEQAQAIVQTHHPACQWQRQRRQFEVAVQGVGPRAANLLSRIALAEGKPHKIELLSH